MIEMKTLSSLDYLLTSEGVNNMSERIDPRNYIEQTEGYLNVDVPTEALFEYFTEELPEWRPKGNLIPYTEIRRYSIDIETTGADFKTDTIKYIGIIRNDLEHKIFHGDEATILLQFFDWLKVFFYDDGNPLILSFHNGFEFDLPFIIERSKLHNISSKCPFVYDSVKNNYSILDRDSGMTITTTSEVPRYVTFKTAQKFGQPTTYRSISYRGNRNVCLIDTYHQSLAWDFVARKLTSASLKVAPYEMGLITEKRLELSYQELLEAYERNDHDLVIEYLLDDLKATMILTDFLAPSIYYQLLFLPNWRLQSIATSGNGTKWNSILMDYYQQEISDDELDYALGNKAELDFDASIAKRYEGGLTKGVAGLFRNVCKLDVASLYPSLMLGYGLCSSKDKDKITLSILKYLKDERLRLKAIAKNSTDPVEKRNANLMQGAMKVMINSAYGFLGTRGLTFNDFESASLVTGYGRTVLRLMAKTLEDLGCKTVELDCVTGDTLVLTRKGVFPIAELSGEIHEIVNGAGDWVQVPFGSKTKPDQVWEVTFKRRNKTTTVRCNAQHKFYVLNRNDYYLTDKEPVRTEVQNMKVGQLVRNMVAPKLVCPNSIDYRKGVLHGIIYGDGSVFTNKVTRDGMLVTIGLTGNKNELSKFMPEYATVTKEPRRNDTFNYRFRSEKNYKELPSKDDKPEYLLGFIRGLIATDGSVGNKDGVVDISGNQDTIKWLEIIAPLVGFQVSRTNLSNAAGSVGIGKNLIIRQNIDTYRIFFELHSILPDDLLRSFHRSKYRSGSNAPWKVISIKKTDQYEVMHCCTEPETHQFTLATGLLSSQTDGAIYECPEGKEEEIAKAVQLAMPEGINLELEWTARAIFIPPTGVTLSSELSDGEDLEGLKKNYIIFHKDGKVKKAGKYRKRDRSLLEKNFQADYIELLLDEGKEEADHFYQMKIAAIDNNSLPIEEILIKRKARKNEKKVFELGLVLEDGTAEFYEGVVVEPPAKKGKRASKKVKTVKTRTEPYSKPYYRNLVNDMYREIAIFIK